MSWEGAAVGDPATITRTLLPPRATESPPARFARCSPQAARNPVQELVTLRADLRAQAADKRSLEVDQETLHKQMASLRSKQSKAEAQEKRLAEHERTLHERETALLERLTEPQPPSARRRGNATGSQRQPSARPWSRASSEEDLRAETTDLERGSNDAARRLEANLRRWSSDDDRRDGGAEQQQWQGGDAGDADAWARRRGAPGAAWVPPPRLRASEDFFF